MVIHAHTSVVRCFFVRRARPCRSTRAGARPARRVLWPARTLLPLPPIPRGVPMEPWLHVRLPLCRGVCFCPASAAMPLHSCRRTPGSPGAVARANIAADSAIPQ
jgi:hypothetical protein